VGAILLAKLYGIIYATSFLLYAKGLVKLTPDSWLKGGAG